MSEKIKTQNPINLADVNATEGPDNIFRTTLAFNPDGMLCHFEMKKGASIPLHNHVHSQIGYVVSGKLDFKTEDGSFVAKTGDSYVFESHQKHGADVIEDSIVIEVFLPVREEYKP